MPGEPGADGRGCVTLAAPCAADACDEATDTCGCIDNDVDGDGHDSEACGGDDCDDGDPLRFPGNPEICDLMNHDEDDPNTPADETGVRGIASPCAFGTCPECFNEGTTPCGATIRPGDRFEIGVVAGSTTDRSEVEITEATVTGAAQCPMP